LVWVSPPESVVRLNPNPIDLLLVAALVLALLSSAGCNAPRDRELDLRLLAGAEKKGSEPESSPPKHKELRLVPYTKTEIEKIFAKVPGPRGKNAKLRVTVRTKPG